MKRSNPPLRPLARALAAAMALVVAAGCASPERTSYTPRSDADTEFATSADRPPTPATLLVMAKILAAEGREAECRYVLERVLRDHPGCAPASNALAEHHVRMSRTDDAIQVLEAGIAHAKNDPVLLNNLGMCWLMRGNSDTALGCFTRAAAASPGETRYRANMAVALALSGRDQEALSLYRQLLTADDAERNLAVLAVARHAMIGADGATDMATPRPSDDDNSPQASAPPTIPARPTP